MDNDQHQGRRPILLYGTVLYGDFYHDRAGRLHRRYYSCAARCCATLYVHTTSHVRRILVSRPSPPIPLPLQLDSGERAARGWIAQAQDRHGT
jgi:hypothetical protein